MLLFRRDAGCQRHEFNATWLLHDDAYTEMEKRMLGCVFPISLLALAANAVSLFVFLRQRWDNRSIRLVLVNVSIWEVLLQSSILLEVAAVFGNVKHSHTVASYRGTAVLQLAITASTAVRNWNMVVLSVSRCELVCRPMHHRLLCSGLRLRAALLCIVLIAFCLGAAVRLEFVGVVCENLSDRRMGSVVMRPLLGDAPGNASVGPGLTSVVFYSFQSLLPPLIVPAPTLLMLLQLRRASRAAAGVLGLATGAARLTSGAADLQQQQQQRQQWRRQQRRQRSRTSELVVALALLFCILESPTFVSTLSQFFLPGIDIVGHKFIFLVNILTVLDSLLNFFVYAAASSTFRQETRKTLLCRSTPAAGNRRGHALRQQPPAAGAEFCCQ